MRKTAFVIATTLVFAASVTPSAASPLMPVGGVANIGNDVSYEPVRWHWGHRHHWRHWGWHRGRHYGWHRGHHYGWFRHHRPYYGLYY